MRLLTATILSTIVFGLGTAQAQPAPAAAPPTPMTLTSSAFADGAVIPDKYTQAGTMSFTLIMHDPDTAPNKGSADVLHWMAFNIPATARSLPENVPTIAGLPDGTVQPNNLRGTPGFMGPGARGV